MATDSAEQTARDVHDSRAVEVLARLGLASRGLVWLVLGFLAGTLALGGSAQADQAGALRTLKDTAFGGPLLAVLGLGFAGYALWLLLSAAVGHRDEDGKDRVLQRLKSLGKGLLYAALSYSTFSFLLRDGSGGGSAQSRTAETMSYPGGRLVVGVAGLVAVGIGCYLVVKGLRRKHSECLEDYRVPTAMRRPAIVVGALGYVGRGVTLGLVGAFLVRAAATFDPDDAKGLDAALQAVASQPYGRVLLGLTVIGMVAYALWSFFEAAYREI